MNPFHLQRIFRITQKKEHLLICKSETTQNLDIYLHNYQTEAAIFLATKHEEISMACSYLSFPYRKYIKTEKNAGFREELLSTNDLEAVLVNFCCYGYGVNAFETVQKISTRTLLELCQLTKKANFIATPMKKQI